MSNLQEQVDLVYLLQMATGYWWSQALHVAARLRVAEALERGPRTTESLAAELSVDARSLFRLLRALASTGLFARDGSGGFALTEKGKPLLESHPRSLRALVLSMGELPYRAWGSLETSVRTGRPAFDDTYGRSYFDYLDSHPEASAIFDASMTGQARFTSDTVAAAFDFSRFRSIVDVGGGAGVLLSAILDRNPGVKGYVFDRPAVVERLTSPRGRIEWVAGDFFRDAPPVADLYLMALVLHDWDEESALRILSAVRGSMKAGSRLLVVESILSEDDDPSFAKVLDLHMLVCFGGAERTEAEYGALLKRAGLRLLRTHSAFGPASRLSILETEPAS